MKISKEYHDMIRNWLSDNLIPIKSINHNVNTAHIREAFMSSNFYDEGRYMYIDNDTINDIMLELGFKAAKFANDPYLEYAVSQDSPAFLKEKKARGKR